MNTTEFSLLVVDDNEDNRDMLSRRLERAGYRTATAGSGQQALEMLRDQAFHLVILDIMMPELDGYQVLEEMKADPDLKEIAVIMLTAVKDKAGVVRCLKLGADDYVAKPFDIHDLRARIEICLTKHWGPADAAAAESPGEGGRTPATLAEAARKKTEVDEFALSQQVDKYLQARQVEFPILPTVAFKIIELARREDVGLSDIAELIQLEPSLAAKLIGVSNSPHYRGAKAFDTVDDAVLRIGLKETLRYVLALTSAGMLNAEQPEFERRLAELWDHSLAAAVCSRTLAKLDRLADPEILFMQGLLHDVGRLLILKVMMRLAEKGATHDEVVLDDFMRTNHARLGAAVMRKWQFSHDFIDVALHHHEQADLKKYSDSVRIVAFANLMAHRLSDAEGEDLSDLAETAQAQALNLEAAQIAAMAEGATAEIEQMKSLF